MEPYVSLCWTSGEDPSQRLIGGLQVTSDHGMKTITANQIFTHSAIADSINPFQVIIVNEKHVAVGRTLRRSG